MDLFEVIGVFIIVAVFITFCFCFYCNKYCKRRRQRRSEMRRKRRRQKNARRKRRRRQRNCQNLQQTAHIEATTPVQNSVPQLETSAATNPSLQATGFLSAFPHLHFPSQQLQTQQHSSAQQHPSAQQHQQLPYGNMAAANMHTVPPPPPYESPPEYQPSQGQFETRINIPDGDTNQFNMPPPPPPYDAHIQHSTPFQFK